MEFFSGFVAAVSNAPTAAIFLGIAIAAFILTIMHHFAVRIYAKRFLKDPKDIVIPKDIDKALEEKSDESSEAEKLAVNFDSADDVSGDCVFSGEVVCRYQGEDIKKFAEVKNEDDTTQLFTFEAVLPEQAICFKSADETNKFLGHLFEKSNSDIDFIVTDYAVYVAK